jgi:hypothetical protein
LLDCQTRAQSQGGTDPTAKRRLRVFVERTPASDMIAAKLPLERRGHHARNDVRTAVDCQALSDHVSIGRICALPEPVGQQDDVLPRLVRSKSAAQPRLNPQQYQQIRCDTADSPWRSGAGIHNRRLWPEKRHDLRKNLRLFSKELDLTPARTNLPHLVRRVTPSHLLDVNERIGIAIR